MASPSSYIFALSSEQVKIEAKKFILNNASFQNLNSFHYRNNLTILDLVVVYGQGAKTNFNINGKQPGGKSSILLFEIKAVHLKDCNSKFSVLK